jgi:type I restriction enzyme M protein
MSRAFTPSPSSGSSRRHRQSSSPAATQLALFVLGDPGKRAAEETVFVEEKKLIVREELPAPEPVLTETPLPSDVVEDAPIVLPDVDKAQLFWGFEEPPEQLAQDIERCINRLSQTAFSERDEGFWQLLYLFCAKLYEEQHPDILPRFYADVKVLKYPEQWEDVRTRITSLFAETQSVYSALPAKFSMSLPPECLVPLVHYLGKHRLLETELDPFGLAYQKWNSARVREWHAQFFTSLGIAFCLICLLQPQADEKVLDPACGAGVFFRALWSYRKIMYQADPALLTFAEDISAREKLLKLALHQYMNNQVYGADFDRMLVRISQMQFNVLGGDPGHIHSMDSLAFPLRYTGPAQEEIVLGSIDVVCTNPPYALPITDPSILEKYELGYSWKRIEEHGSSHFCKTSRLQKKVESEVLFLEQSLKWLKPGGRLGMVVPDSLLGNSSLEYVRYWLLEHAYLLASISLPPVSFRPQSQTGVKASLLVLRKKTEEECLAEKKQKLDYAVYMAVVDSIGFSPRGNTIYKRKEDGSIDETSGKPEVDNELPLVVASYLQFLSDKRIVPLLP